MALPLVGPDPTTVRDLVAVANETTQALRVTLDGIRSLAVDTQDLSDRLTDIANGDNPPVEELNRIVDDAERRTNHVNVSIRGLLDQVVHTRDLSRSISEVVLRAHHETRSTRAPEPVPAGGA
jgi:hypothetical protein